MNVPGSGLLHSSPAQQDSERQFQAPSCWHDPLPSNNGDSVVSSNNRDCNVVFSRIHTNCYIIRYNILIFNDKIITTFDCGSTSDYLIITFLGIIYLIIIYLITNIYKKVFCIKYSDGTKASYG